VRWKTAWYCQADGPKGTMYLVATLDFGVEGRVMEPLILRRGGPEDEALRFELFAAEKALEFERIGLTEDQYRSLLEMQYRGRGWSYAAQHSELEEWILCTQAGSGVGRYLLEETVKGIRVLDLAVLPQWRGRGIATEVLQMLAQRCCALGVALSLRVVKDNPAVQLYARLGLRVIAEDAISYEMIWRQRSDCEPREWLGEREG
jgi:GNAT superfamily N-acetyltransferase